jgi:hypothetical protein
MPVPISTAPCSPELPRELHGFRRAGTPGVSRRFAAPTYRFRELT